MSLGKYAYGAATVGTAHVYARYAYTHTAALRIRRRRQPRRRGRKEEEEGFQEKSLDTLGTAAEGALGVEEEEEEGRGSM